MEISAPMDDRQSPIEAYFSVDIESSGPTPRRYSMLSIGACKVDDPVQTFYVELKPLQEDYSPEALAIHNLSIPDLLERGLPPSEAMARFEAWIISQLRPGQKPVFVAFNAPFDWMFVNDYFHHYLGHNPFGHAALDIKAFYMGLTGLPWMETSMEHVGPRYLGERRLSHHALQDALDQASIFRQLLIEAKKRC